MVICTEKKYQSYYTNSAPIVKYMTDLLEPIPDVNYLEPAAGEGVFIDPLLDIANINIDAFDINPESVYILRDKYKDIPHVTISEKDTLIETEIDLFSQNHKSFDRIIANPPYGAWQDYNKREKLKKLYPGMYVKETYALFLYKCIQLLNEDGILVFIIPDTFLNLHMHTKLRKFILEKTKVHEISLFPSNFFPNVNFGYANLCIIKLQKCKDFKKAMANEITIKTAFQKVSDLVNNPEHVTNATLSQNCVYNNIDHALFIPENKQLTFQINKTKKRISDIAECVTGFYSGNDKEFLKVSNPDIKGAKKYQTVDKCKIFHGCDISLDGITSDQIYIPFMKGGNSRYYKPTLWYMDWSQSSVTHYKMDKKSRFQNSKYYFKNGVGVPMVSSSKISGALINNRLFDQSIVGIFPLEKKYLFYLLAFFNSNICNSMIRTINPSANNSANYLKKIPFIQPQESTLSTINKTAINIYNKKESGLNTEDDEKYLDSIFTSIYT